jgi:hypothetical protein
MSLGAWVPWCVPVVAFGAAIAAQVGAGGIDVERPNDPLYLPDATVARHFDMGFSQAWADWLHIQALIYVVEEFDDDEAEGAAAQKLTKLERQAQVRKTKFVWLSQLYNSITELDPKFKDAYLYGARFLTLLGNDDDAAIALLKRGIAELPNEHELLEELGMIYYIDKKDPATAIKWLQRAITHPGCSPMLVGFVTRLSEGTDYDIEVLHSLDRQIADYAAKGDHRMEKAFRAKKHEHFARIALRRLTDMYQQAVDAGAAKERLTLQALQDACLNDQLVPPDFFEMAGGFWYEPATGRLESNVLAPAERKRRKRRLLYLMHAFRGAHEGRWAANLAEFSNWSAEPVPPHPLPGWAYGWDPATGTVTEQAP